MLFHRVFSPESTAYCDQFSCRLTGVLDVERLRGAWQALVDRHSVLRTSFHWEGLDQPVQVVHAQATLPWTVLDWRGVPRDEQAARWHAHLERDRTRGFAPDAAPLMRVTVARIADDDHYCCWSHHHLLLDGWCLDLVLAELFTRYECLTRGEAPRLAPVRPYGDYIAWLQRRDAAALERYWREALRGFRAPTPFTGGIGTGTPRGAADAAAARVVAEPLASRLRALTAKRRLTLNTLIQGAWALLLSRYSGHDDVVFGATVSGRPPDLPGVETMLGVFVNTLPVRVRVDTDRSAAAWLADVQAAHVAREPHAAIALSDLQKLSEVESGTPIFDTNVIVMNYRLDEQLARGAAGFRIGDLQIVDRTELPLTLQVTPGRQTTLEIVYDSGRFDAGSVTRMLGHVEFLLEQFAADLDRPLAAFDIVTPAERARILDEFNATAAPLDADSTVLDRWDARAAETPEGIALECDDVRLTFRELDAWTNRLARALAQLAPPGRPLDRDALVALAFARSERLVAAVLATWKSGAAYVPIDPAYPSDRIRHVLDSASPVIVVRDAGTLDAGLEAAFAGRAAFVSMDDLDRVARDLSSAPLGRRATGGDLAYVIFTSGSTGQPKGAMVEHVGLLNHLLAKIEDFHLDRGSIVVQNASHCFDISVWQAFAALAAGGRTLVYRDDLVLDPARFLARVRADRVTVLEVVPSYLAVLLDRVEADPRPLADLQVLLVTGEAVKPALVERWFELCPSIPLANAYGPTEASDDITHAIMREPPATATVPVGRPLRNFHIYIVDAQMRLCPIGVPGEVCVSGPGVGRGYLNDPARTAAAFIEDPFRAARGVRMYRTGDIGWFTADGTILLAGRRDHQVKVRGYRIELGDVEAALAGLAAVRDAAVVDRRDRGDGGAYLAAYVSVRDPAITGDRILEQLAARLPEYMVPSTCSVLAELPLTPNGKIDRRALPAPERTGRDGIAAPAPPRTADERLLADVWRDVLGVDEPGIHDNFFAAGGDSILSMQLVSRASRVGLTLTPRDVFQHQTIAGLAALARPVTARAAGRERSGPVPLAPAQQTFVEDVTVDRHHYNQSILLEIPAGFDADRARRALDAVVRHHEALRLRFTERDGTWEQSVAAVEESSLLAAHDLSRLSAPARLAAIDRIGASVQGSLDLARGPLLRAVVFDFGAAEAGRLLIVVHHLAVDGVSWRVMLDDVATAYESGATVDGPALPPAPASYLDWAEAMAAHGPSGAAARPRHVIDVPCDVPFDAALNTVESTGEVTIVLDDAATRALLTSTAATYRAGPTDVLVAATALTCAEWAGRRRVAIDLEMHGRDAAPGDLDLTRTVGWFTATVPVQLDLPDDPIDPADVIALVKARIRGAAGGTIATSPGGRASLLFNYHGRVDQEPRAGWRLSSEPHGPARSPRQQREYLLEINGLVSGGRLRLTIAFSRNVHREETIAALARDLEARLRAIVDRARSGRPVRLSPADVSAARLDQPTLDRLLARLPDLEDVYELSPTQQGLLFHGLVEPTNDAYFNQLTCVLRGPLDIRAFQEAWREVTARHAALRTSFHWKDVEQPLQVVHSQVEIPWVVEDWSTLSADEQDRRWTAQAEEDRRRAFDLSAAPLMRCTLSRIADEAYRFRWSQHHLLLDGWSASIVLGDVLAAYDAIRQGRHFDAPVPPPFRQNIRWLQQQDRAAAERFWRRELGGFTTPPPLVVGLPEMRGEVETGRFGEAELRVPDALASRLVALAAANQITLSTLFQGVWALLLSQYGGEADVVFGAIVSGRATALERSAEMVGLFINTVPVRARLDAEAPLSAWLRDLQRAGAEREVYSYSSLADVQRWSDVEGGTPLFETIVIFENYPVAAALADAGGTVSVAGVQAFEPNNYPLTFVVTPGASLGLKIMFDAGRFDGATIDRTLGHVHALLSALADDPHVRIGALSILTAAERAAIDGWNRTEKPVPAGATVLGLIEAHANAAPARTAVIDGGRGVSYGELNARANQLARVLDATGRLAPEARIVVMLRRSALLPETVLAVWKCGAAYVPVDPEYPDARIATIVTNARAAIVIADGADLEPERVAALRREHPLILLDEIAAARDREATSDLGRVIDPSALAYVIFTSGSTGVPKGAMVEHAGLCNHVLSMIDELGLGPGSVVAQTASHCFDISMWQLFAGLAAGGTTAVYPDTLVHRPAQLAARFDADRVSVAQFVPSYLNVFLDVIEAATAAGDPLPPLAALVHLLTIGEALKPASIERWFRWYPRIPLMNAYGPTEASDSVAHFDMTAPLGPAMVPIGRPIQNLALYVVDPSMRLCPVGVKGEVCIAGVGVGRGYLFDEARTAAVFLQDPFAETPRRMYRTGDVGCYAPDGNILFFGRRDFQVKVRGHRIELGEVETCLAALDGVRDAAVVTREREGGYRVLCGYVTAQAGRRLDEALLQQQLAGRLPSHAIPDVLRVLPEMPSMPNGKVDRRALAALEIVRAASPDAASPATDTERTLIGIWSEVLEQDEIGVEQSFFDLGGHSLTAIQVASRVSRACGVDLGVGDVFANATVRRLAGLVDSKAAATAPPLVAQPARDDYEASPIQKRIWLASRTTEGSVSYNMAGAFWLEGLVDRPALGRAFTALVERHEALRTGFFVAGGVLRQRVRPADAIGAVLRETDWRDRPAAAADIDAALRTRVAVPFDLAAGSLVDVELLRLSDRRGLLLVRLHHLAGDAGSMRILLREALTLYAAFRRGEGSPLAPLAIQHRDVVAWQRARAAAGALEPSRRYWLETLDARMPRTEFPRDPAARSSSPPAGLVDSCDLDEATTRRLRTLAAAHGATLFAVVVSAVYALAYRYSGQSDLVIGTTVGRRDHPLLDDQVGCYIDTLVLRGRAGSGDTAGPLIERTARVCRDALAHGDYPFDALLDDLRLPAHDGGQPVFDVLVDYVPGPGALAASLPDTGLTMAEHPLAAEAVHAATMFLVGESDDGATLSIRLVFDDRSFTRETVALARDRLLAILHWLAADGAATLGDVDLLGGRAPSRRRLHIGLKTR
jgi:amino acid adenylation domain-containing protein/non-ribosomal peptide synthase protein (TIGR01720 family)